MKERRAKMDEGEKGLTGLSRALLVFTLFCFRFTVKETAVSQKLKSKEI